MNIQPYHRIHSARRQRLWPSSCRSTASSRSSRSGDGGGKLEQIFGNKTSFSRSSSSFDLRRPSRESQSQDRSSASSLRRVDRGISCPRPEQSRCKMPSKKNVEWDCFLDQEGNILVPKLSLEHTRQSDVCPPSETNSIRSGNGGNKLRHGVSRSSASFDLRRPSRENNDYEDDSGARSLHRVDRGILYPRLVSSRGMSKVSSKKNEDWDGVCYLDRDGDVLASTPPLVNTQSTMVKSKSRNVDFSGGINNRGNEDTQESLRSKYDRTLFTKVARGETEN